MREIVSPSNAIRQTRLAAAVAVESKQPVIINDRVWLPINNAAIGEETPFVYEAEIRGFPRLPGVEWQPGQAIYWAPADLGFALAPGAGRVHCGYVLEPDSGGTETGLLLFQTFPAPLVED